jgi:hypothetical protein
VSSGAAKGLIICRFCQRLVMGVTPEEARADGWTRRRYEGWRCSDCRDRK